MARMSLRQDDLGGTADPAEQGEPQLVTTQPFLPLLLAVEENGSDGHIALKEVLADWRAAAALVARHDQVDLRFASCIRFLPAAALVPTHAVSEVVAVGLPAEILMHVLSAIVPVYRGGFRNPLE